LSSYPLSINLKTKIQKTITLSVVWYKCQVWALTLREEHRLRVFENRVLRRIYGPKKNNWQEAGGDCVIRSLITSTLRTWGR
jgi:hypothetical protein